MNAFAVGLPAVFWRQQGFLDVVAGSDYPAIADSALIYTRNWHELAILRCLKLSLKALRARYRGRSPLAHFVGHELLSALALTSPGTAT